MSQQLISIITPTYNSAPYLESCILSVAQQSYAHKEHLFIDNLSTDSTLEIIQTYMLIYPHIRIITEKDNGIYDAMNKGIEQSSGEWLYFMGCDDIFFDNDILTHISNSGKLEQKDVIYGNVLWGKDGPLYDGEFTPLKLLNQNICHQAIFFNRRLFKKLGLFEIEYKIYADWVFNMRWFFSKETLAEYVNLTIAIFNPYGYSSIIHDSVFMEKRKSLVYKYFPKEYTLIFDWRNKENNIKSLKRKFNTLCAYIYAFQTHIKIVNITKNITRKKIYREMTKTLKNILKSIT